MPNVILDLDQTLISAEEVKKFNAEKYKEKMQTTQHYMMDKQYIIFARPHLQEFLDYLFENFNVSVWTAATKSYALFIIEKFINIKPNRKLDFIFFSYHCDYSQKCNKGLKGLSLLWENFNLYHYNPFNTVIIDDNPDVKDIQECNCYAIKPYYFTRIGSENDKELLTLIERLKTFKTVASNVSPGESVCLIDKF